MDLSLSLFEQKLGAYQPAVMHGPDWKRSAVAVILRFHRGEPDVLLMKRAERKGDSWSGHISFPGGREAEGDIDLRATAMRETMEEVGIDLAASARFLGQLDTIRAVARGRARPMTITPFAFVETRDMHVVLGDEAVEAFWFPLDRAAAGELSGTFTYDLDASPLSLPCWRYEGRIVWGLTYQMLSRLLDVVTR